MKIPKIESLDDVKIETSEGLSRIVVGDYKGSWYEKIGFWYDAENETVMAILDGQLLYPAVNETLMEIFDGKLLYPAVKSKQSGDFSQVVVFDGKEIRDKTFKQFKEEYWKRKERG